MTDQKALYARLKPELDAAFTAVMESMSFTEGPQVQQLADRIQAYLPVAVAFPCAADGSTLRVALQALALPAGAAVILPAFGDAALAETVLRLGLTPVFADVQADTFTLDPEAVAQAITPTTRAILPVHLFGQCAAMEPLLALTRKYDLKVVEDNSQAFGAVYSWPGGQRQKAGTMGHCSISSFFPAKPLAGQGEGAAICTNEANVAAKVRHFFEAGEGTAPLDALQAAMLTVKLKYTDAYHAGKIPVAQYYDTAFAQVPGVQPPVCAAYSSHVYQQYVISVAPKLRDGLQAHLRDNYIPSMVYYPQPLHLQEAFGHLGYKQGDFPVAEKLSQSLLSLPMHSELKQDQLAYICGQVQDFMQKQV